MVSKHLERPAPPDHPGDPASPHVAHYCDRVQYGMQNPAAAPGCGALIREDPGPLGNGPGMPPPDTYGPDAWHAPYGGESEAPSAGFEPASQP